MPTKPSPAATKKDITMLMEHVDKQIRHLYDANERWKNEVIEETKRHFDVVAEHMRHELLCAHKDRIENHEDRITRIEERVGIAS